MSVENLDSVMAKIRALNGQLSGDRLEAALTEMSDKTIEYAAIITPIKTSNLLNSRYRRVYKDGSKMIGEVGYTANYALYVHEAPEKLKGRAVYRSPKRYGYVWSPNGENKFLEKGALEMAQFDADEIIKRYLSL